MPSTLTALLCLGLCLSQMISSQKHHLLKPIIWAKPNSMIPKGKPVTIWCQGTQEAVEYHLLFKGQLSALKRQKPHRWVDKVRFPIPAMTIHTAGRYSCVYLSGELWSEPSEPLDLVVTGMYDVPTLSVQPRPEVVPGEDVIFRCRLETATNKFFLLKEGRSSRPQQRHGENQADFPIGPVKPAHRGTYRCFGSYNDFAWSFPSEPVALLVMGPIRNTSLAPKESTYYDELTFWDHTAQNFFQIGMSVLILMAMVGLLVMDWLSRKRTQERAIRVSSWEHRRRFGARRHLNKFPREAVATGRAESWF
ncbi:natural cytotoxicity triggering receptor 1 [Orycteropus afer afer]|uniref:Natural cytotoxicity triggering receptor 1 n=1 Tax=Orycteropus afer afer TaxID=1230840 RepID=A0A8B7BDX3_ORYAF|nr:natural cytotoxicity triggering receptor 1 [Orycteropus afer afer]